MILKDGEELLTASEAAEILSRNAGRKIEQDYVRVLASSRYNKLSSVALDGRTKLYPRSEVEKLVISEKPGRKKTGTENT